MCTKILQEVGGPQHYLQADVDTLDHKNEFASWLVKASPEQDDVSYVHSEVLPPVEDSSVHVAALVFDKKCSVKPPPFLSTTTVQPQAAMSCLFYSLTILSAKCWRRSGTTVITDLTRRSRWAT